MEKYRKSVLGCKENRRYETGIQKLFSEVIDRGKGFLRHPSSIDDFPATSHCFIIIIYLFSPINHEAKWAGSDATARPHVISFSNGCALNPQTEALENVSRVIIYYLNME